MSDETIAFSEYIRCSKNRLKEFKTIARDPSIPSRIADELSLDKSIVSKNLKQFKDKISFIFYIQKSEEKK